MSKSPNPALPWFAFAFCCAVWSSTFLFIRLGNDTMPPIWSATLRLTGAAVLFTVLALATRAPWPRGRELEAAVWFGIVDFGISIPLLYWGEVSIPSGLAAVLYATIPLTAAITARAFGLEPLRLRIVAASIVSIGGVALLFSSRLVGAIHPLRLGAVFLAAITAGIAGPILKRAPDGHPFTVNAWGHALGAVLCLVASRLLHEPMMLPSGTGWIPLVYLTLVGSLGAFAVFAWLVRHMAVTRVSFISVVVPVVAMVLGMVFLHERPGPNALLGSVVILGAVITGIVGDQQARVNERD